MANLLDIRTRMKADLAIQGTVYDTQIDDAIRSAIRMHEQQPMWFLEAETTKTLSIGTDEITLPTDFASPIFFRLLSNNVYYSDGCGFDMVDTYSELLQKYQKTVITARPSVHCIYGNKLKMDTLADADYTISILYYQKDSTLPSDDADTSVWLEEGQDVIRTFAMAIFKDESKQFEGAANDWVRAEKYLSDLRARNTYYQMGRG